MIFMQVLCDFDMIRHISEDLLKMKHSSNSYEVMATSKIQKVFIHGFYLYYVVCEQNVKNHKYTKDYCEVSCWLVPSCFAVGRSRYSTRLWLHLLVCCLGRLL